MSAVAVKTAVRRPLPAGAIFMLGSACVLSTLYLKLTGAEPFGAETGFQLAMNFAFVLLGAITVWRRPDNRTSWLLAWVGLTLGLSLLMDEYGTPGGGVTRASDSLQFAAKWFSSWLWVVTFGPLTTLLLLWFPTGRPPSSRWKPVERVAFAVIGILPLVLAFGQDPESAARNPLAIPWVTAVLEKAFYVLNPVFPALVAACAVSLIVRFRRSRGDERQQLKWFVVAAALVAIYIGVDTSISTIADRPVWLDVLEAVAFLSLPTSAGLAILKYRLYDIDLVINRALVYGSLTAILAGAYVGLVFGLQAMLAPLTAQSDIAVAASTLAVAALFRPMRSRVQNFIDKRFYRRKVDAKETIERFTTHLRDEVDLSALSGRLVGVVSETLQPAHVSLWLKEARS